MSNTEELYYIADLHFALTKECSVLQFEPPPDMKFETKENNDGTKSITGFVVMEKAFTEEEALEKAKNEAKKLVDILAVLSGGHLGYFLTGHNMRSPDGRRKVLKTFIGKYDINSSDLVDLSQGNFPNLIKTVDPQDKDRRLVERLHYAIVD